MNRLSVSQRSTLLGMMMEGNSLRSCARMVDVSLNTVTKLMVDLGFACGQFHNTHVNNLRVRRLQCDEIWSFVGAKKKNVAPEKKAEGCGDVWTWTGLDADTKLCVAYLVGGRHAGWAKWFMDDCARRIKGRVQVTTDGHRAYLDAVEGVFGLECDYAVLQKIYGPDPIEEQPRYSPACCIGCESKSLIENPDPEHIGTSYVERFNLTMRMSRRRFTRLTNAFSKKVQNHSAMVAIHAVYYNYGRIHKTLRVTPAMESGLTDHVWSLEEIITTADSYWPKPTKRGPYKREFQTEALP